MDSTVAEIDETAWLEETAAQLRAGRTADVDLAQLAEYLTDMAKRDRREVKSRLAILIAHLLKWKYQPGRRCLSWQNTIRDQREELEEILTSTVLLAHAHDVLPAAWAKGRLHAIAQTGLADDTFPVNCPMPLSAILKSDIWAAE